MASSLAAAAEPNKTTTTVIKLKPVDLTPELFAPYGQVVGPTDDGAAFGADDAQLELDQGTPRCVVLCCVVCVGVLGGRVRVKWCCCCGAVVGGFLGGGARCER